MIGKKLNLKKVRFTKREAKQQQIIERIWLRAYGTSQTRKLLSEIPPPASRNETFIEKGRIKRNMSSAKLYVFKKIEVISLYLLMLVINFEPGCTNFFKYTKDDLKIPLILGFKSAILQPKNAALRIRIPMLTINSYDQHISSGVIYYERIGAYIYEIVSQGMHY